MGIPRALVEAVREHRVVPFIGAGVSVGVKWGLFPTWKQLTEKLVTCLSEEELTDGATRVRDLCAVEDFLQAAEVAYEKLGAYRWNRCASLIRPGLSGPVHRAVAPSERAPLCIGARGSAYQREPGGGDGYPS
jgi:hypothetical protein